MTQEARIASFILLRIILGLACAVPMSGALKAQEHFSAEYADWNLPSWVQKRLAEPDLSRRFARVLEINPYFQHGDFSRDGRLDVAVVVNERTTGKRGVLILHSGSKDAHVLGAGNSFGNGGDDWRWMWVWRVEPTTILPNGRANAGHVLYVAKPEAAGALIYWDGRRYHWLQWGD